MTQRAKRAFRALQMVCTEIDIHLCACYLFCDILGVSATQFPLQRSGGERKTLHPQVDRTITPLLHVPKRVCNVKSNVHWIQTSWLASSHLLSDSTLKVSTSCVSTVPLDNLIHPFATLTEKFRSSCQPRAMVYQFLSVFSGSAVEVFVEKGLGTNST